MRAGDLLLPGAVRLLTPERIDVVAEARDLVAGLVTDAWGQVSASAYETGRLVSLAPWLTGHAGRVGFLLDTQRPDGGWGAPGGYALVPTLSATEALLAELGREGSSAERVILTGAAERGVRALRRWSGEEAEWSLPDMPAIELIVPALTSMINDHLGADGERLDLPQSMSGAKLSAIRARLASGAAVPQKLVHALEVVGEVAAGIPGAGPSPIGAEVSSLPIGAIGASPAASAAWLGADGALDRGAPVRRYLEVVAERSGGPVPCATPITVFERGWTLSWLLRAGIPVDVPGELAVSLSDALGPEGTAAGPGLPPDADTTSVALYALALLEIPCKPDSLWPYETDTHFCTWGGEEGASPTVNAHVLDAFGEYLRRSTGPDPRYETAVRKLAAWLRGCQMADGSWLDRWHASPYYATACCALALQDFGGEESAGAVREAVRWLLGTQRQDGSWGRWEGTAEETAYAMQTLLLTGPAGEERPMEALERGYRYLMSSVTDRGEPVDAPPLWHDKDLYSPRAIVKAAVLGALYLTRRALLVPSGTSSVSGEAQMVTDSH